jgi:hypothetical protein
VKEEEKREKRSFFVKADNIFAIRCNKPLLTLITFTPLSQQQQQQQQQQVWESTFQSTSSQASLSHNSTLLNNCISHPISTNTH